MTGIHVGIIMDGNGRWARSQGYPRWRGHLAGVTSVREVVRGSPDLGVTTLTLYAFSTDNWKRPRAEVNRLFWILREFCRRERVELIESGVRVTGIGRRDRIPKSTLAELEKTEAATLGGQRLHLRLAIDYGARWQISQAARALAEQVRAGELAPEDITPDHVCAHLCPEVPEPDLIIRTAGEQRLSDFLLWESAYAELYFTPVLWPDFRPAELAIALSEFEHRERRFGSLNTVRGPQQLVG